MIMDDFIKLRSNNYLWFSEAKERLNSDDEEFKLKVQDSLQIIKKNMSSIVEVIQEFFDHPNINFILGVNFSKIQVELTLKNEGFVAFLVLSNLYNRIMRNGFKENKALIVRVYFAILDYNIY